MPCAAVTLAATSLSRGRVGPAALEEANKSAAGATLIVPDDLTRVVDAQRKGVGGRRRVESGVSIDWHDVVLILLRPRSSPVARATGVPLRTTMGSRVVRSVS